MYGIYLYRTIAHTLTSLQMYYDKTVKEVIKLYRTTFHNILYIHLLSADIVCLAYYLKETQIERS